jgi:hypothetical protein
LLVFCTVAEDMFKEINGKFVFTELHTFKSAYYVDKPVAKLYTPEFKLLITYSELHKRTRAQIAQEIDFHLRHREGVIDKQWIEVPWASEAHTHLNAGSTCYLWLPEYKEPPSPTSRPSRAETGSPFNRSPAPSGH